MKLFPQASDIRQVLLNISIYKLNGLQIFCLLFREEIQFKTGGRFSKSTSERESMLQSRKEQMLQNARK